MTKYKFSLNLFYTFAVIAYVSLGSTFGQSKNLIDFSLRNIDGKIVSLKNYKSAKGFIVVFVSNHCPFAKLYTQRFNQLNEKYKKLGIPLIAVSSTDTVMYKEDTYVNMVRKGKTEKINFPFLYDGNQEVAKLFHAQKTPHAFVIWKEGEEWVIKYNGAIDDNGAEIEKVEKKYVANAVDALLSGKPVEVKEVKSIGCRIIFRK
jgi:peroxiredoxin